MRRINRSSTRYLDFASDYSLRAGAAGAPVPAVFVDEPFEIQELYARRLFPDGGWIYIEENGWPCALTAEAFAETFRKTNAVESGRARAVSR